MLDVRGFSKEQLYLFHFCATFCSSLEGLGVGGDTFAGNVLKIETWKPICQVDVCRRRNCGYRDTTLGCSDFLSQQNDYSGEDPGVLRGDMRYGCTA